jgi:murein DD-endopeptidase MepM/ murein hydrolase activator NlpD
LKRLCLAVLFVLGAAGPAAALELDGPVVQGALRIGVVAPGSAVSVDGQDVRVAPQTGQFVFGVGRDRTEPVVLGVTSADGATENFSYVVAVRDYDIERIDGLPPRKVTPDTADVERIRREGRMISAARARDSGLVHALSGFVWPMTGRISGRYGNQRILNGKPRRPHLGVDIAAPQGTPVGASAAGLVSLAETDMFYTGGTVVIDHGHGVTSIYSHLATINVAVGQTVTAGEVIGSVGSTGRSTGPHLDWRINWFDLRLDPELIAGPMPVTR